MFPVLREQGQGLVEYALILVFISIVVIVAVRIFGLEVVDLFDDVVQEFQNL